MAFSTVADVNSAIAAGRYYKTGWTKTVVGSYTAGRWYNTFALAWPPSGNYIHGEQLVQALIERGSIGRVGKRRGTWLAAVGGLARLLRRNRHDQRLATGSAHDRQRHPGLAALRQRAWRPDVPGGHHGHGRNRKRHVHRAVRSCQRGCLYEFFQRRQPLYPWQRGLRGVVRRTEHRPQRRSREQLRSVHFLGGWRFRSTIRPVFPKHYGKRVGTMCISPMQAIGHGSAYFGHFAQRHGRS